MNKNKKSKSNPIVSPARIIALITLVSLVAMKKYENSQTDIGSALGVVYLELLIIIFIFIWVIIEVVRYIKK